MEVILFSNLYEYFNCSSKEELYQKVRDDDASVRSLVDFIDYSKGSIENKHKGIHLRILLLWYPQITFVISSLVNISLANTFLSTLLAFGRAFKQFIYSYHSSIFITGNAPNDSCPIILITCF